MNILKSLIGDVVGTAMDRLIPDKNAARRAKEEMEKSILSVVATADIAQSEVNKAEAQHRSIFVAGWRPGIGWVCAASLFAFYIPQFVMGAVMWTRLAWAAIESGQTQLPDYPVSVEGLMPLITGMLGMGGLRTWEKIKGVARDADPKHKNAVDKDIKV